MVTKELLPLFYLAITHLNNNINSGHIPVEYPGMLRSDNGKL